MDAEKIVATILLRDNYRRTRIQYLLRMIAVMVALTGLSLLGTWSILTREDQYRYLMTEPTGKLLPEIPLDQRHASDEDVLKWTMDAVTRLYTFDLANHRRQFQAAQRVMTPIGWDGYQRALRESGNFVAVVENKYVTTAAPSGPARILSQGLMADSFGNVRWSWTIEVPILVTYQSSKQRTSQDLITTVNLIRVPAYVNYTGAQIRQIIAR